MKREEADKSIGFSCSSLGPRSEMRVGVVGVREREIEGETAHGSSIKTN